VQKIQDWSRRQPTKNRSSLSKRYAWKEPGTVSTILYRPAIPFVGSETYHNRHPRRLHNSRQDNQQTQNPPPILAQPFPTPENNHVGDYAHSFQHHGKGHQEPDRAPHGTEIPVVAMTVVALGETLAGIGERGAALMETVGVVVGGLERTTM
jgi:hypothetical protein